MLLTLSALLLATLISLLLMLLGATVTSRSYGDREKLSPFECGFDPKNTARLPFSTRFFLLAVIFLVFDIEIVLLLPAPLMNISPSPIPALVGLSYFMFILMAGLLHEWAEGSLDWMD